MNKPRGIPCLALFLLLLAPAAPRVAAQGTRAAQGRGASAAGASRVARAFYRDHFARRLCCFDEKGLRARRAWFTPGLYELMLREARRPVSQDEAPYFNGDPFTDSQEPAADFALGRATVRAGRATVPVTLHWADDKGKTVDRRTCRLAMHRAADSWRIDDILYSNGLTLRGQLKESERQNGKTSDK